MTSRAKAERLSNRFKFAVLIGTLISLLAFAQGAVGSAYHAQTVVAGVPGYDHIFLVMDENKARSQVIGPAPYLTGLANANAQSSNYFAVCHPSVCNYLALFSGQTYKGTINDNCKVGTGTCHTTAPNLANELIASGRTAKGYMESMPSPCYGPHDAGLYTERHNPFPYFDQIRTDPARCASIVPYTQLASDLSRPSTTPNFAWITPNLQNDMHSGSLAQGDAWAQSNFPAIFNSPAWKTQRSLLIFTLDEDNGSASNNVAFFVVSSDGSTKTNYTSTVHATAYSALRTIEAAWGLGTMTVNDAAASPMSDLFTGVTPTPGAVVPQFVKAAGATESSASTSLTDTFSIPTLAGHLLVLSASVYTGTTNQISSVTDSGGNTWTRIGAFVVAGHNSDGEMWYAANAGAVTSVTVHTAKPAVVSLEVQEFSGVATSSPLDVSTGNSSSGTSPGSGSVTPTAATDLAVGFVAGHSNPQAISVTATGFSAHGQQTSSGGRLAVASVVTGYQVLTSAAAQTFTGSFSSSMYWAAGIVAFKAAP